MSTVLTTTERPRQSSLRDSVRRIFTLASSSRSANRPGMFDGARNTSIQHANFTINQYGALMVDRPPSATEAVPARQIASESTPASSQTRENDPSPTPRRESPDVYVDYLLTEKRGYPLWIPSPNRSLPPSYRTLGVSVGDVGVLTPEGGFDFLFNIFYDATHPINAAVGVPDAFVPFTPAPTPADVQDFVEWDAGSFLADASIVRKDDGRDRSTTILEATGAEGAVLMIPEDIYTTKLKLTTRLREYVQKHMVLWYRFVKHTLGHDIENGDLRVVYGCRKSSGFGIATAFNTGQGENTRLSFLVEGSWADTRRCPYRWTHTGSAEVKTGPSGQDNVESFSTDPVRNQCLFVNTIDARVASKTWNSVGLNTVMYGMPSSTFGKPNRGKGTPTVKPSSSGSTSDLSSSSYHQSAFHPSVILLDILETITPGLLTYITCDDDWAPSVSDNTLNTREFVDQILENSVIVEDQGMLFFCASSDANLLEELRQRDGAQIRFSRIDDPSNVSCSYWRAERRVSPDIKQVADNPVKGDAHSNNSSVSILSPKRLATFTATELHQNVLPKNPLPNLERVAPTSSFTALQLAASNRIRREWQGFHKTHSAGRTALEHKVEALKAKADTEYSRTATQSRIPQVTHDATKAKLVKDLRQRYFDGLRSQWQAKLLKAGLKDEQWVDISGFEMTQVLHLLGSEDESDEDMVYGAPPTRYVPLTQSSLLYTAIHAPSISASTRASQVSDASSHTYVDPSEFHSEEEDFTYYSRSTSAAKQAAQAKEKAKAKEKEKVKEKEKEQSSAVTPGGASGIKSNANRAPYIGPSVDDPEDNLTDEEDFERFKMQTRFQKIAEYHQAAALAEIQLSIKVYRSRKAGEKHLVSGLLAAHQKGMWQLQATKEEERKALVDRERSHRWSELHRQPDRLGTTLPPTPSVPMNPIWLHSLEDNAPEEVQAKFDIEQLISGDPNNQNVDALLQQMLSEASSKRPPLGRGAVAMPGHNSSHSYSGTGSEFQVAAMEATAAIFERKPQWPRAATSSSAAARAVHRSQQGATAGSSASASVSHLHKHRESDAARYKASGRASTKPSPFGEYDSSSDEVEPAQKQAAPPPPRGNQMRTNPFANPHMASRVVDKLQNDPEVTVVSQQYAGIATPSQTPVAMPSWGSTLLAQTPATPGGWVPKGTAGSRATPVVASGWTKRRPGATTPQPQMAAESLSGYNTSMVTPTRNQFGFGFGDEGAGASAFDSSILGGMSTIAKGKKTMLVPEEQGSVWERVMAAKAAQHQEQQESLWGKHLEKSSSSEVLVPAWRGRSAMPQQRETDAAWGNQASMFASEDRQPMWGKKPTPPAEESHSGWGIKSTATDERRTGSTWGKKAVSQPEEVDLMQGVWASLMKRSGSFGDATTSKTGAKTPPVSTNPEQIAPPPPAITLYKKQAKKQRQNKKEGAADEPDADPEPPTETAAAVGDQDAPSAMQDSIFDTPESMFSSTVSLNTKTPSETGPEPKEKTPPPPAAPAKATPALGIGGGGKKGKKGRK